MFWYLALSQDCLKAIFLELLRLFLALVVYTEDTRMLSLDCTVAVENYASNPFIYRYLVYSSYVYGAKQRYIVHGQYAL